MSLKLDWEKEGQGSGAPSPYPQVLAKCVLGLNLIVGYGWILGVIAPVVGFRDIIVICIIIQYIQDL